MPEMNLDEGWRQAHVGHWLHQALQRFDARVLSLMARHVDLPLALSNLAARGILSASHVHITRHLALEGSRLTDLAQRAGMTKQAMGKLVEQCEAWGLVERLNDPRDARAKRIVFTPVGLLWLRAFRAAVAQAEDELRVAVGVEVATVIAIGLEAYAS
jgi:DNA-binding MarR family transcriptional regulator